MDIYDNVYFAYEMQNKDSNLKTKHILVIPEKEFCEETINSNGNIVNNCNYYFDMKIPHMLYEYADFTRFWNLLFSI